MNTQQIAPVNLQAVKVPFEKEILHMTTKKADRATKPGVDMLAIVGKLVGEKSILGLVGLSIAYLLWTQYLGLLEASEKKWEANAVSLEKRIEEAKAETRLFSQIVAANTAQSASTEVRLMSIERAVEKIRP